MGTTEYALDALDTIIAYPGVGLCTHVLEDIFQQYLHSLEGTQKCQFTAKAGPTMLLLGEVTLSKKI